MKSLTLKALWVMFIGIVALIASALGILTYFGVSPNEAVQNIQVMVTNVNNISTVIDIEGLEDLTEFGRELKERDIVGKLDNYLTP